MRILLVRTGGLGDCLVTLPVAAEIRRQFANAEIDVLGNGMMGDVGRYSGLFSRCYSIDNGGFHDLFSFRVTPFLRDYFSQYKRVYFYSTAPFCDLWDTVLKAGAVRCRVLNPQPTGNPLRHITDHLATILEDIPVPDLSAVPFGPKHFPRNQSGILTIHPGSGGISKNWPLERFLAVAKAYDGEVRFVFGPVEIERTDIYERISASLPYTVKRCETLDELVAVLASTSVFLGNDSGAGHMAAMMGVSSVILFGPTDERVWRPVGRNVNIVKSTDGHMKSIDIANVLASLKSVEKE